MLVVRVAELDAHQFHVYEGLLTAAGHPAACQVQVERDQHGVHRQVGQHMLAPQLQ